MKSVSIDMKSALIGFLLGGLVLLSFGAELQVQQVGRYQAVELAGTVYAYNYGILDTQTGRIVLYYVTNDGSVIKDSETYMSPDTPYDAENHLNLYDTYKSYPRRFIR